MNTSTNHGDAVLHTLGQDRLDHIFSSSTGSDSLMIGQNRTPDETLVPDIGASSYAHPDYGVAWHPSKTPGHALIIGANRQGKGAGIIVPWLLTARNNMVVLDFKCELAAITAKHRREKFGHRTVILDPTNTVNKQFISKIPGEKLEIITNFNPLSHIDPQSPTFDEDVTSVGEAIGLISGPDPFWTQGGRDAIVGGSAGEVLSNPGKASLRGVRQALAMGDKEFAAYCTELCERFPDSLVSLKLGRFQTVSPANSSIRGVASQQLGFLDNAALQASMETDENQFDWRDLAQPGITVYICCPVERAETYAPWLRLCLQEGMRQLLQIRPSLGLPVLFLLDEMPVLGRMPIIRQAYGVSAGMGIVCASFCQGIEQLQAMYPEEWQTFTGNSAVIGVLAARGETAKWVSQQLGYKTVQTVQESENTGTSTTHAQGGGSQGSSSGKSVNYGEMGVPVMDPHQVEKMDARDMLVLFPGGDNLRVRKLTYFTDARFWGRYRPDPHYPPSPQARAQYSLAEWMVALSQNAKAWREQQAKGNTPGWLGTVLGFIRPTKPYTGSRKLGAAAALVFWGLMLITAFNQVGPYFNTGWYLLFAASTGLAAWAVHDQKHRVGIVGMAVFVVFMLFQGSRNPHGIVGVFTSPLEFLFYKGYATLLWDGFLGLPLFAWIWPLFLFDAKFRWALKLAWGNGYTKRGEYVQYCMPFDSLGERMRVMFEAGVFVAASVSLSLRLVTLLGSAVASSHNYRAVMPFWLASALFLASLVQAAAAIFLAIPMLNTFRRPSPIL